MGRFDITGDPHPSVSVTLSPEVTLGAETRPGHYLFAHYALRSVARNDPVFYFGVLASPDGPRFLDDLLQTVADHTRPGEPPPDFSAADCRIHTVRAGIYPCAVVELPPPRALTEAYFTAVVLLVDPAEAQPDLTAAAVRYFTLELSFNFDATPVTLLCEWGHDGAHHNFGPGSVPEVEVFVRDICRLLNPIT